MLNYKGRGGRGGGAGGLSNHKTFSSAFKKEVAVLTNESLKKKNQMMFGILKNENGQNQPVKLDMDH